MLNLKMLKSYLTVMNRVIGTKQVMPVLGYALLTPFGIKVTNLDLEFELKIDTGLTDSCLVLFSDLKKVATLAKKSLALTYDYDTNRITLIADDKRNLSFKCYDDFNDSPLMVVKGMFAPKCGITGKTLAMLGKFLSKDELRPAMSGIYFDTDNAVATDAHRLAFPKLEDKYSEDTFILSGHNIKAINVKSEYTLSYDGVMHCKLENDDVSIISRKVDSRYPDYKAVLPTNDKEAVLDKKDFLEACKYALLACNQTTKQLNIDLSNEGCKMTAKDVDFDSDFESVISGSFDNIEPLTISVNGVFAEGIVKECDTEKVSFKVSNANRAFIVNDMFLLMPVMRSVS